MARLRFPFMLLIGLWLAIVVAVIVILERPAHE